MIEALGTGNGGELPVLPKMIYSTVRTNIGILILIRPRNSNKKTRMAGGSGVPYWLSIDRRERRIMLARMGLGGVWDIIIGVKRVFPLYSSIGSI